MNEERIRREREEIEELREQSHKVSKQVNRYYKVQLLILILGAYGLMLFLVKDKQIVPYLAGLMALISIINCIFFCRKMSKLNKLRKQLYDKEYELDRYLSA
jgi:FtsH-binding integral membrane protein